MPCLASAVALVCVALCGSKVGHFAEPVHKHNNSAMPSFMVGSCVIRSRDTLSHTPCGFGRGCSRPPGFLILRGLLRWMARWATSNIYNVARLRGGHSTNSCDHFCGALCTFMTESESVKDASYPVSCGPRGRGACSVAARELLSGLVVNLLWGYRDSPPNGAPSG